MARAKARRKEFVVPISEGRITKEALEEWQKKIGIKLRVDPFNENVTEESLRKFANGIGDTNPLWFDKEYAEKTRFGTLVAQLSWLYSVFPTWVLQGLPGVHADHSGNDWSFYRPIYLGDKITPECIFTGFEEKESKFAGRMVIEYQRSTFWNQHGELVAETNLWLIRAERSASRKLKKYGDLKLPHPWTEEELKKIEEDVLAEEVRGSTPRYWEDVKVGDELKHVVKGPFGLTDMIAYCVGAAPVKLLAHGNALRLYRKHPAWAFRDPFTYAWEPIYSVHYNKSATNALGLPYPYDVGTQRQCWLIHLLTNWMGDEGWLKKNYAEYRRFVYHSDVVYLSGKVTKRYIDENGEHCVDIETWAKNQRGENVMPGHSSVVLPSRDKAVGPLDSRLRR